MPACGRTALRAGLVLLILGLADSAQIRSELSIGNLLQAQEGRTEKFGFYMHVFAQPAAVIDQLRQVKRFFPSSPVYIMSDGGMDFTELCKQENCIFKLCPPANDRWHPWPFLRRMYDAAMALKTEYVIMLEPDNSLHGPIKRMPTHDAGGLYVPDRTFGCGDYVEGLAQKRVSEFKWTKRAMSAGLAGGSYYRTEAILDAFSDKSVAEIDWNFLGYKCGKNTFSSDFAMQYALAARGWQMEPWNETVQMAIDTEHPAHGPQDAAFWHYSRGFPGGKPTYKLLLNSDDAALGQPPPSIYKEVNSVCQICYSSSRYTKLWGSAECTNRLPFEYSDEIMKRHHPEINEHHCPENLAFLCEATEPHVTKPVKL